MSESNEAHVKIDRILRHVKSLDGQTSFLVRAHSKELTQEYVEVFKRKKRAIRIFMLVDDQRSVGDIAGELRIHIQAVSNDMSVLEEAGLVYLDRYDQGKKVYAREPVCSILRLEREFQRIIQDGTTKPNTKGSQQRTKRLRR